VEVLLKKTDVWNDILVFVEQRLNRNIFETWFRPIQCEGSDDATGTLHLRAGQVTKDWVALYYANLLDGALSSVNLDGYRIEWHIDETETAESKFSNIPGQLAEQSFAAAAGPSCSG